MDARDFQKHRGRRFGSSNPERMNNPFWEWMVERGVNAFWARKWRAPEEESWGGGAVWCFQRFGVTRTRLADGRVVCIGGEHEDYYDPDFCIYNDVIVVKPDGKMDIYGYPREVFPPTDFHTATLVGEEIWIIGRLGYREERKSDETPVYRLNLSNWRVERVLTTGISPGRIYEHQAVLSADGKEICVSGGKQIRGYEKEEAHEEFRGLFVLNLAKLSWQEQAVEQMQSYVETEWPVPWYGIDSELVDYTKRQIRDRCAPGHVLFAGDFEPLADGRGKTLCRMMDGSGRYVVVEDDVDCEFEHSVLPKPVHRFYDGLEEALKDIE